MQSPAPLRIEAMAAPKPTVPKLGHRLPAPESPEPLQQQRLMIVALTLLVVTLGFVLYHDRDFWFPDTIEADNQPMPRPAPAPVAAPTPVASQPQTPAHHKKTAARRLRINTAVPVAGTDPPPTTITRTVLPPLEVEVIAGSSHKKLHPGTNAVHVDLQPDSTSQEAPQAATTDTSETAASISVNAAEQAQLSPETEAVVTQSVRPGYPMLARQMKVQGSVILEALIGRDGLIQDLRVVSGPPILATAAREAVKQWHFKPHYEGANAVETQAKITVNFTISTN